ncbi:MAG: thioredoxin family protein [Candidatus Aminicenantes bacterium]
MKVKRKIEVFIAGCSLCEEAVEVVRKAACPSCEAAVLDMKDPEAVSRARSLGVGSVPEVAIEGKLADCCAGRGPDEPTLRQAGLGQPIE